MNDKGTIVQQLEDERDYLLELLCSERSEKTDLKSQLRKVKEAAEPFGKIVSKLSWSDGAVPDETEFCILRSPIVDFTAGDIRRLAEALKEVKDD